MSVSIQRYPIFDVASPLRDLVFYEVVDYNLQNNRDAEYGDPYHNTRTFPNHELVYITPNDKEGKFYRFYYAAKRENQDDYNWQIQGGERLVRTYFVKRELYYERSDADILAGPFKVNNEFGYPTVATLDSRFEKYGFADDTVAEAPQELSSLYILVQRRFIEPVTEDLVWDQNLNMYVRIKKEIIPAMLNRPQPTSTTGETIEVQKGNRFHDIRITKTAIMPLGEGGEPLTYPILKTEIPDYRQFDFPARLNAINLVYAWAYAASEDAMPSYSEDFYFDYDITEPRKGLYPARLLRYVTDDPENVKILHPITTIPAPVKESIAVVYTWSSAGVFGNTTQASAKEYLLPSTIHDQISVDESNNGPLEETSPASRTFTRTFAKTDGYDAFMALDEIVVGYEVREISLNLFEAIVVILDKSNAYAAPTNAPPDVTDPLITNLSPQNNLSDVSITNNLVVTFSEAIAIGYGNITIKNLTDSTEFNISVEDPTQVTISGSVLTINPTNPLINAKNYAVRISGNAIKDLSGNKFAGIFDDNTWNFYTIAATPP